MGTARLNCERLILRKYTPEDAERLFQLFGGDSICSKYTGWNPYLTLDMAQNTVNEFISNYQKPHFYGWAVELDSQFIGTIGAYDYDESTRGIEIGYSIGQEFWGNGYGKEAASYVCYYLMEYEGIKEIYAWCIEENVASKKICESLGMEVIDSEEKQIGEHIYKQLNYGLKV